MYFRIPKPGYLLSQLTPRGKPDTDLAHILVDLIELYQLGEIQSCYRAPQSANSTNFIVLTSQGQFVFRRHRLSKDTIAHEHQILVYLQQCSFSVPRVILSPTNQEWTEVDNALYSFYEFVKGYCPADFWWWSTARRDIITRAGRTLGEYHQAVIDLTPSYYKWDGYRPTEHRRWREVDWFRQAVADIQTLLKKGTSTGPIDDFARVHLDSFTKMLDLESTVEGCSDLSKLVIHGDFAPWNILLRPDRSLVVLDFNAARLDLKIFDIIFATFWFAWRGNHLDRNRAMAFQTGYGQTGQLRRVDIELAATVFQWIMARAVIERLRRHYQEQVWLRSPDGIENFYRMCIFAQQSSQELVAGLKGMSEE